MMQNGPELWDKILEDMKLWFPNMKAIVAGGAVRDYRLGFAPKDIDVFIDVTDELEFEFGIHDIKELGIDIQDINAGPDAEARYGEGNIDLKSIIGVYEITNEDSGIPVQIIGCKFEDGPSLIDTFDANICQCFYDGGEPVYTEAAQKDMLDRTYTVRLEDKDYKTEARFHRFNNRMRGNGGVFHFVDPFREAEQKKYQAAFDEYTTYSKADVKLTTKLKQFGQMYGMGSARQIL